MTVADRIKEKRTELGLSQTDLAKKIGRKDRSSICQIENSGDNISMKNIVKIAEALNVTPQYLLGWSDNSFDYVIKDAKNPSANHISEYSKQFAEKFSNYTPEEIERAIKVFEMYENSTPEVRQTIELLLKSTQQNP